MEWQKTRTYRLAPATVGRLDRLAEETEIYHSRLVDALLMMAMDYVEMGYWEIVTKPGRPELDGIRIR